MRSRLLIADSDDAWLDVCQRGLCDSGFTVATARDGLACLAEVQRNAKLDVVVLELDIPWGGADGVLAILREEACLPDHLLIIVTGEAPRSVLSARSGIPSAHCLPKPFHVDELLNLVGGASLACVD